MLSQNIRKNEVKSHTANGHDEQNKYGFAHRISAFLFINGVGRLQSERMPALER